jgi:hypothetical protein
MTTKIEEHKMTKYTFIDKDGEIHDVEGIHLFDVDEVDIKAMIEVEGWCGTHWHNGEPVVIIETSQWEEWQKGMPISALAYVHKKEHLK